MWWWPRVIAPVRVEHRPASTRSVLPTVFAFAGQPRPAGRMIDGRDTQPGLNAAPWLGSAPELVFVYTGASAEPALAGRPGFSRAPAPWPAEVRATNDAARLKTGELALLC